MLLRFQWQIEKLCLKITLGPGFISASPLNNSIDNRKLECDHMCKTTKILVKIKICKKEYLAVLQYLYLSDKNILTKIKNIWIMFEIEKFFLFKLTYDTAILFM